MHQYIYIKLYTLRAFQILKYLVALIFIRVHSPLFLCHFSTVTFSHWVSRSWSRSTRNYVRDQQPDSPTYYCFGCIVDFVVLLVYYSVCVDRSGSLSSGAFNQLKLVTLNIVLTILYSLKSVSQGLCYSVSTLYISLTKSSNIYSRHPHCNIK